MNIKNTPDTHDRKNLQFHMALSLVFPVLYARFRLRNYNFPFGNIRKSYMALSNTQKYNV